ncbi:MAG: zinc transporter ZntB [Planctomycetota bacterium]
MPDTDALIFAMILDGRGGGRAVGWDDIASWTPQAGPLWLHLDRSHEQTRRWLEQRSGLDELVVDSLLAEDTRPRFTVHEAGAVVILRGVNLNPGTTPDDMTSLRMWVDAGRLISMRMPKVAAVGDVRHLLETAHGPTTSASTLVELATALTDRVEPVLDNLDEVLGGFESQTDRFDRVPAGLLTSLRRQAITLHRYLRPQRDALAQLSDGFFAAFTDLDRRRCDEAANRVTRFVEDLDALRDRATVVYEDTLTRQSERMNRTTYLLTLIATIFLPLGFITGLLGINVGGIPLAESGWGFVIVCVALGLIAVGEYLLFRWMRLL